MTLRMANTAAKFLLALYTARYLGLADLGVYGLLVGGTILTPALLGLGTSDWVVRQIVTMSHAQALAAMTTRLALPVVMHAIAQPLLWLVNVALGAPVPWPLMGLCADSSCFWSTSPTTQVICSSRAAAPCSQMF